MSDQFLTRANAGIAVLAEHFPAVFAIEGWQPHKPLKVRIHKDVAAAGIMPVEDIGPALRLYVCRLMYQRALAAGGSRYGLDGEPCGEVTAKHAEEAAVIAAHIEAEAQTKGTAAITARQANRPRKTWKVFPDGHDAKELEHKKPATVTVAPSMAPELATTPATAAEPAVKRLGLADLRKAAQERRARNHAHA
jgi:sRNA-binding protein